MCPGMTGCTVNFRLACADSRIRFPLLPPSEEKNSLQEVRRSHPPSAGERENELLVGGGVSVLQDTRTAHEKRTIQKGKHSPEKGFIKHPEKGFIKHPGKGFIKPKKAL